MVAIFLPCVRSRKMTCSNLGRSFFDVLNGTLHFTYRDIEVICDRLTILARLMPSVDHPYWHSRTVDNWLTRCYAVNNCDYFIVFLTLNNGPHLDGLPFYVSVNVNQKHIHYFFKIKLIRSRKIFGFRNRLEKNIFSVRMEISGY